MSPVSGIGPPGPGRTRCRYCGRTLSTLEHYSGDCCSAWRCRERRLESQLEAYRHERARQVGEPAPERYAIAVIPHREGRLGPIEPERLLALERHLCELTASVARDAPVAEAKQTPAPVPEMCTACHGACCYHGGAHAAFLDEDTIGRFAAGHPALDAGGIVAEYLRHVPDRHFEGSCVYHAERGCTLPRTMRADICNAYECRGLKQAREHAAAGARALFIVARHDNTIVRGEFV
jgi:hypothetical protein